MCIIAYIPEGKTLEFETLEEMCINNPHSFGLMFVDNNKINVYKTLDMDKFINYYFNKCNYIKSNIIIHCRIATHGKINIENCHPFKINKNLYFVHNGIIDKVETNKRKSDTVMFNETILKKLPNDFLNNKAIIKLISDYIDSSKLAFMNNNGDVTLINENMGEYNEDGIWFSNRSYIPYKSYFNSSLTNTKYDFYNSKHCSNCGNTLYDDELYCTYCLERSYNTTTNKDYSYLY
jgi:glutamine amidotransferase